MLTYGDITAPGSLHTKTHIGGCQATLGCIQLREVCGDVCMGAAKDSFAGPAPGHYTHVLKW